MSISISLIVPVYKAEQCLRRCVDSILAQSFTDFELILVDDGSPDHSGTVCDEYATKDNRVVVIHKENGGVSTARNMGLDVAQGEFVGFIDSDDAVDASYLATLYQNGEFDFVSAGFKMQGPDKSWQTMLFCEDSTNSKKVAKYPSRYMGKYYFGAPWAKLFKRDILNQHGLRFPLDIHNGEDTLFIFQYLGYAEKIKIVPMCGYNYFFYTSSLAHRVDPNNFKWRIQVEEQVMGFFKPCNANEEIWLNNRLFEVLMGQVKEHFPHIKEQVYQLYKNKLFEVAINHQRKSSVIKRRLFIWAMEHRCYKVYVRFETVCTFCRRVKNKVKRTLDFRRACNG